MEVARRGVAAARAWWMGALACGLGVAMRFAQVDWRAVVTAAARECRKDDVPGLAAEMAFNFSFALFPFALFLSALAGAVGRLAGGDRLFAALADTLYHALPPASAAAVREVLDDVLTREHGGLLSLGALLALWFASNGVATVMKAFNRTYGVEETRAAVTQRLVALALTLVLSALLLGGAALLLFGDRVDTWLGARLWAGGLLGPLWAAARLALVLAGVSLALALLYWQGPNVRQQFKWITPGSVLATLVWVLATAGFGFYVRVLGASSWSRYYGAIVGLLLLQAYLYLTSLVALLGAELNAETTKRYDPLTIGDKLRDPRKQLPGKQPRPAGEAAREAGVTPGQVAASNARSAAKLADGAGSPATAAMPTRAERDGDPAGGEW
jgi:membrane protein